MSARVRGALQNLLLSLVSLTLFFGAAEGLCRLLERRTAPSPSPVAEYITPWSRCTRTRATLVLVEVAWPRGT